MTGAESCPDCGARLPAGSPAGLCPLCLLRLGAALSADLAGESGSGARPTFPSPRAGRRGLRVAGRRVDRGRCDRGGRSRPAPGHAGRRAAGPARLAGDARPLGPAGALPARRRARPGRDGGDLPGARRRPRPGPGRQGDPGGAPRPPGDGPPVRRGGPDRRPAPAPGDRPGPRAGPVPRRPAVHRHEAGPGPHPGGAAGGARGPRRGPAAVPLDLRAGLPDDGLRPQPRGDPPRPEAVERHGRRLRRGPGDGLGPGQGARPGGRGRRASGRSAPATAPRAVRTLRSGSEGRSRGPARCSARRRTWPPSRPGASWTRSTSGRTSSASARSSARSSPASRPTRAGPRPRSTARRSGPTCRTRWRGSTPAMPTPSWSRWRGRAWPPRRRTGRGTRAWWSPG